MFQLLYVNMFVNFSFRDRKERVHFLISEEQKKIDKRRLKESI